MVSDSKKTVREDFVQENSSCCGASSISTADDDIKHTVREGYGRIAKQSGSCCGSTDTWMDVDLQKTMSKKIGYTDEELSEVPADANLGLGCGNPVALASLKEGEVVLDLGSGPGLDCFLAANKVAAKGKVIGVDMTPEMIERARKNAKNGNYENIEFRLGEIENVPVADNSVDIIISNCVINLSPDKEKVFREAFSVLKPGGRFMISDLVLSKELPSAITQSIEAYIGCISGALLKETFIKTIKAAGFQEVKIIDEKSFPIELMANDPMAKSIVNDLKMPLEEVIEVTNNAILSINVYGVKPV
ncbi:MAG: arsenite methyltransferase [Actinobacteria bacterium]|nr:arsenite methyltransferase [Actinomycetota bacterium]